MLLAVAAGDDYQQAARAAGRRSGDAVSHLVARFNAEGLAPISPRHGGGRSPVYDRAARERVLAEVKRTPTPEADGTATWSLSTLPKALRSAPDGLPTVSTYTLCSTSAVLNHSFGGGSWPYAAGAKAASKTARKGRGRFSKTSV